MSLWLSELGLGPEYWDVVQEHDEFFKDISRREALKKLLKASDTPNQVRMKMLAVCVGSAMEASLDEIIELLLDESGRKAGKRHALD